MTCRTVYHEAVHHVHGSQRFGFQFPFLRHIEQAYEWIERKSPLIWLDVIGPRNCAFICHISLEFVEEEYSLSGEDT